MAGQVKELHATMAKLARSRRPPKGRVRKGALRRKHVTFEWPSSDLLAQKRGSRDFMIGSPFSDLPFCGGFGRPCN